MSFFSFFQYLFTIAALPDLCMVDNTIKVIKKNEDEEPMISGA